jgi:hypothetical protein
VSLEVKLYYPKTLKSEASMVKITCLLGTPSFIAFFKVGNAIVFLINNYRINSRRNEVCMYFISATFLELNKSSLD